MARATNTEIIEKLKDMEERLPNGELKEIQEDLKSFKSTITQAIWVVYVAVIGLISKIIWGD